MVGVEIERLEGVQPLARHDARGDLGDRLADGLGDEGHRAAGARVHFDQINIAVLDRELHVHQPADFERLGQFGGLAFHFGDDVRRQTVRRQ